MTAPLLQVQDLSIRLGAHTVVRDVSFALQPGEKLALVGESGSGKTVTALSLLQLLPQARTQGSAVFSDGERVQDLLAMPEDAIRALRGDRIAMIFQEPMTALDPLMTVGAQIAEVLRAKRGLDKRAAAEGAAALLDKVHIPQPAQRALAYPHQLSGGQRQRAMIAMALACEPALLLADEPTTALDAALRGQILALLDELRAASGMAVLMITHDLNVVRRFADRVMVMQHGRVVEQGGTVQLFAAPQQAYTRELLDSRPVRDVAPLLAAHEGEPVTRATALRVAYFSAATGLRGWFRQREFVALQAADFCIAPGQTLGVIGESGSGKSTLAQAVLGLLPPRQVMGVVQVTGQAWRHRTRLDLPLRRAVQVVFQDPFSSLSPRMTVGETVEEGLRLHFPALTAAERRARVLGTLADVGLPSDRFPSLLQRYPHEFSGGQRQRIALARALVVQPRLIVLDEPTSALDVTVQKQVITLLQGLQREHGLSYLLITHDMAVVASMAHTVLVLKDGVVVEQGPAEWVLQHPQDDYTRMLLAAA